MISQRRTSLPVPPSHKEEAGASEWKPAVPQPTPQVLFRLWLQRRQPSALSTLEVLQQSLMNSLPTSFPPPLCICFPLFSPRTFPRPELQLTIKNFRQLMLPLYFIPKLCVYLLSSPCNSFVFILERCFSSPPIPALRSVLRS